MSETKFMKQEGPCCWFCIVSLWCVHL